MYSILELVQYRSRPFQPTSLLFRGRAQRFWKESTVVLRYLPLKDQCLYVPVCLFTVQDRTRLLHGVFRYVGVFKSRAIISYGPFFFWQGRAASEEEAGHHGTDRSSLGFAQGRYYRLSLSIYLSIPSFKEQSLTEFISKRCLLYYRQYNANQQLIRCYWCSTTLISELNLSPYRPYAHVGSIDLKLSDEDLQFLEEKYLPQRPLEWI